MLFPKAFPQVYLPTVWSHVLFSVSWNWWNVSLHDTTLAHLHTSFMIILWLKSCSLMKLLFSFYLGLDNTTQEKINSFSLFPIQYGWDLFLSWKLIQNWGNRCTPTPGWVFVLSLCLGLEWLVQLSLINMKLGRQENSWNDNKTMFFLKFFFSDDLKGTKITGLLFKPNQEGTSRR